MLGDICFCIVLSLNWPITVIGLHHLPLFITYFVILGDQLYLIIFKFSALSFSYLSLIGNCVHARIAFVICQCDCRVCRLIAPVWSALSFTWGGRFMRSMTIFIRHDMSTVIAIISLPSQSAELMWRVHALSICKLGLQSQRHCMIISNGPIWSLI